MKATGAQQTGGHLSYGPQEGIGFGQQSKGLFAQLQKRKRQTGSAWL